MKEKIVEFTTKEHKPLTLAECSLETFVNILLLGFSLKKQFSYF